MYRSYDYGMLLKIIALIYLAYIVIIKNLKCTIIFFILYIIASIFSLMHLYKVKNYMDNKVLVDDISDLNTEYKKMKINTYIYANSINIFICIIVIILLYN
jgi:hypothetical protein